MSMIPGAGTSTDDGFAQADKRLTAAEALALLRSRVVLVVTSEMTALNNAHGRFLAEPLIATRPVPGFDNVAVDGFAFAHASLDAARPSRLELVQGSSAAGHPFQGKLEPGQAVRVLTGGRLPAGADTAVMQEDARLDDRVVIVPQGLPQGANCRAAGEDMRPGQTVLPSGCRLTPQAIGVAAAQGRARLLVHRRLNVALVSTGDELTEPGEALPAGMIYDSNRAMLRSLLIGLGADVTDQGIWPDKATEVERRIEQVGARHQAIVTSGGASHGDEDHVVRAVARLGRLDFWRIAVKPGRPLAFGRIGKAVFIGLPGNPVAAMISFVRFVRPVLSVLAGGTWPVPRLFKVKAAFAMNKKPGRLEYLRARLVADPSGDGTDVLATRFERDGSGMLMSLTEADGLIELAESLTVVRPGDLVPFIPFGEFGLFAQA